MSSSKVDRAHHSVMSDLPVNRADDISLKMMIGLFNSSAWKCIACAEQFYLEIELEDAEEDAYISSFALDQRQYLSVSKAYHNQEFWG